jgi:hypothetical protein
MSKKVAIPWELKADFRLKGWTSILKGFLYAIREKYGADEALKMYERVGEMDDRHKNLTNSIKTIFKIEGNDIETIAKWFDIWWELTGEEYTWLERSKTIARSKITQCPFKTGYEDISEWELIFRKNISKAINPKAIVERPKAMCAGDPYCEHVFKIEE